jgi:hypothetical protein
MAGSCIARCSARSAAHGARGVGPWPELSSWAALRRPQGGFHALHLGYPPACAPAFPLRSADDAWDRDVGVDGIMHHAPGAGLIGRQGGQIGEIGTAAFPLCARVRTDQGIKAHWRKELSADTAWSCCHFSVSSNRLSEISTPAGTFNSWPFVTAAGTFCHGHRHFRPAGRFSGVEKGPVQSLEP